MALSKPINEIILPEKREQWFSQIRPKWFVIDENDIDQARFPGK